MNFYKFIKETRLKIIQPKKNSYLIQLSNTEEIKVEVFNSPRIDSIRCELKTPVGTSILSWDQAEEYINGTNTNIIFVPNPSNWTL